MLNEDGFDRWAEDYDGDTAKSDGEGSYPFAGYQRVLNTIARRVLARGTPRVLDLGFGKCRMAEAAPVGFREDRQRPLRVATKYPAIARRFYAAQSREIEIIKLNGSIELAPLLGLSDVIVDIVETGTTLRQNNLEVTREILPISARFIANKAAMKFKEPAISSLLSGIQAQLNQKEERP